MIFGLSNLGQDDGLSEARARVEALKRQIAERKASAAAAEASESAKAMADAPPPPPPSMTMPPASIAPRPQYVPQAPQSNGNGMKNYMALLGVGLVAGLAVVILQRAFRRS